MKGRREQHRSRNQSKPAAKPNRNMLHRFFFLIHFLREVRSLITFLIRRDRHCPAQCTVRRKGAFHVHRYQTSKQPFPTLKRIRQNCSSNCARDFGAGRFPVEGSLGAIRNHVDAATPVECGEKNGEFLQGNPGPF